MQKSNPSEHRGPNMNSLLYKPYVPTELLRILLWLTPYVTFYLTGFLTVGYIHTENCGKCEKLERSLESLFSHLEKTNENQVSVVIILRDCSETNTAKFLDKMQMRYNYWIKNEILQIVKIPDGFKIQSKDKSQYWETFTSHSPEYIEKAKSLIRYIAFLWKFSARQSDYFIQFTDHVIIEGDLLSSLLISVKNWTTNHWLWAENFRGLITGSIYKTDSFSEFVELFDIFGSYMPVNFILKFYKRNLRISKRVREMSKPLPIREHFEFNGDNPAAVVTTSLVLGGDVPIQDLYKNRKGFFWAWTPKEGDYILINFKQLINIKRVLIETGTYLYEDIFPSGVVSVLFGDSETMKTSSRPDCHDTGKFQTVAEFREPSVEISGRKLSSKAIGCIKINVSPVKSKIFDSWIIIRTISIFTK